MTVYRKLLNYYNHVAKKCNTIYEFKNTIMEATKAK